MKRTEESKEKRMCLKEFFRYQIKQTKKCENCGIRLINPSFFNQAHILPKSRFKSVMCEKDNCLHLCQQCHHKYDSSWRTARTMKVWSTAVERFNKFKHKVTEKSLTLLNFKNK